MRKIAVVLSALGMAMLMDGAPLGHHGPGIRGFNSSQNISITGVITKCLY